MTPLAVAVIAAALLAPGANAKGASHGSVKVCPSSVSHGWKATAPCSVPKGWHAPKWWLGSPPPHPTGVYCLHAGEGAWGDATGNGYEGGLQWKLSTWIGAGGSVVYAGKVAHWASVVSPREELFRCWLVWLRDGRSFSEWGTAGGCGLR